MTDEDGETSMIGAVTVDTASIASATVTINTLTISGKQVTLDVFRQLQDAVLINHDGRPRDRPGEWSTITKSHATSLTSMRMWCGSWVINSARTPSSRRAGSRIGPTYVTLGSSRLAPWSVFLASSSGGTTQCRRRQRTQRGPVSFAGVGRGLAARATGSCAAPATGSGGRASRTQCRPLGFVDGPTLAAKAIARACRN